MVSPPVLLMLIIVLKARLLSAALQDSIRFCLDFLQLSCCKFIAESLGRILEISGRATLQHCDKQVWKSTFLNFLCIYDFIGLLVNDLMILVEAA